MCGRFKASTVPGYSHFTTEGPDIETDGTNTDPGTDSDSAESDKECDKECDKESDKESGKESNKGGDKESGKLVTTMTNYHKHNAYDAPLFYTIGPVKLPEFGWV